MLHTNHAIDPHITVYLYSVFLYIANPCTKYTIKTVVKLIELHPTAILNKAITSILFFFISDL